MGRRSSLPPRLPAGPFLRERWPSPLRGPWLSSILGAALLPLIGICALTGYLSHAAYDPDLGANSVNSAGVDLWFFHWPTSPAWLYALNQGLHVTSGLVAIPVLLAKLWSVMPKLYEWPPLRSVAHALERLSLAFLVGGSVFVFATGVLNIQLWYPFAFPFVPAHWYGAIVFVAALALHVGLKLPLMRRTFRERGVTGPLRDPTPEPYEQGTTAPLAPAAPTISRRGLLGSVGAAALGMGLLGAGQSIGGPLRGLALLAPHGRDPGPGPNGFQVNKTARAVGIRASETGASWRLHVERPGGAAMALSRDELLAMAQVTESLPIACVEGWSTTQTWTGIALRDLARMAGAESGHLLRVESLQRGGAFRQATLSEGQIADDRSLLALRVNGADLSLDHGFPARVIVPALPGVHCTKWVAKMTFVPA
jgi:DMSO/TMAO reductase YedYZ molybdopterin-dependent catalytic subunit